MGPILGVIQIEASLWVNFEGISLVGSALFGLGVISWTQDMWVFWGLGISKTWSSTRPSSLMPMTRGKIASRFSTTRSAHNSIFAEDLLDQGEPGRTRKLGLRSQTDIEDLLTYLTLLELIIDELTQADMKDLICSPHRLGANRGIVQIALPSSDLTGATWKRKWPPHKKTSYETSREILENVHTFELFDPKKWGIEWSLSYADSNYWENVDDSFEGQHVHSHF